MKALKRIGGAALVLAVLWGGGRATLADPPKPLSERQVLDLVEIKIPDDVIAKRVIDGGVDFAADEEVIARLKKAGASDAVLAAVKKVAKPAAESVISLWVEQDYHWDCGLHSELKINDKAIGTFTSNTDRAVGAHLKPGWNTITLKTTPQPGATKNNQLIFRVGAVTRKDGKRVMSPVLWEFRNGTDWKLADGKYTHQLGPDRKDVTLTYKVYYAGLEAEARKPGAGDFVLTGEQDYGTAPPLTATVFVNGHPVNTFLGGKRQVVITKHLHKGENTIKLVSARVPNVVANNNVKMWAGGPAEYNVTAGRLELKPVVQFEAMHGWKRDAKTGQLVNQVKSGEDTIEREIKFTLDAEPGKR